MSFRVLKWIAIKRSLDEINQDSIFSSINTAITFTFIILNWAYLEVESSLVCRTWYHVSRDLSAPSWPYCLVIRPSWAWVDGAIWLFILRMLPQSDLCGRQNVTWEQWVETLWTCLDKNRKWFSCLAGRVKQVITTFYPI